VKRIFFVAGESSGDTHGANLIRALRALAPDLDCEGLGGHFMAEAGMTLRHDLAGQAIMGFLEVVKHLKPMRRLLLDTIEYLRATRPDALVVIDYPGFNIRLAEAAHAMGIPVVYYISPQVWAWKKHRIHKLARIASKMLVIFPFEEALYHAIGMKDCVYVGHPLIDHIAEYKARAASKPDEDGPVIGILPGSREQELARLVETMIAVARGIREHYPNARFLTPCVNEARAAQFKALAGDFPIEVSVRGMYDVLARARFCLVASGTATLETALFDVPMVILYRVSGVTYHIGRWVISGIEHIGIVNILAKRGIVPEFIQQDAAPEKILPVALGLIADTPERARMLEGFEEVRMLLGAGGASERAAREILELVKGASHG
jgi:lipid-A-disaccharide synthase